MLVSVNCKYNADITGNVIIGYINRCHGNIVAAANVGTLAISYYDRITLNPQGNAIKAGKWIQGYILTFLR